jgi:HEAT repeat protein
MEAPRSERVTLSRDLSEFLVELSIALHRHSMYPVGHPALGPAIAGVVRRAEKLLEDRPSIAFGVARRQLIIDGVTTDPDQPVLRRLAEALHEHHIGAISLLRGVEQEELSEALRALGTEAERDGAAGKGPIPSWPHVKVHPLTFDGLALVSEAAPAGQQASQSPELWLGLARAALMSDGKDGDPAISAEPAAVAKAIDEAPRAEAYDQVIVGYLMQITQELKTASGESVEELRRRTSRLISSLRPGTLRRLVEMGGSHAQREQFVADAADGMAVDAVLEIVKAAADASGQTISHGLVRMLKKLAAHAELGSDLARPRADVELREQVNRLIEDWRLEDPNPEAYRKTLEHLATEKPTDAPRPDWAVGGEPEPLRMVQMGLEAGAFGPLLENAVDQVIQAGQLNVLLDLLTAPPPGAELAAEIILAMVIRPESVKGMLAGATVDLAGLDNLLPRLALDSYEPLLEALGSSESRIVRRRLLELLSKTNVDISPLVIARLGDERWYVQRNMLMLLARGGRVPESFSAFHWTTHPDVRVRVEAIRLQLTLAHERDLAIHTALNDLDPRIIHVGLTAIRDECPPDMIDRVIELTTHPPEEDENIRLMAVTALARIRDQRALDALLRMADGGRSLLTRQQKLPQKTPVLLAVIRALAAHWPHDSRAAAVLMTAAKSSDPELRQAGAVR